MLAPSRDQNAYSLWTFCCYRDAGVLRARRPGPLVRAGFCRLMSARLLLRFSCRHVAVRPSRSDLGGRRAAAMVAARKLRNFASTLSSDGASAINSAPHRDRQRNCIFQAHVDGGRRRLLFYRANLPHRDDRSLCETDSATEPAMPDLPCFVCGKALSRVEYRLVREGLEARGPRRQGRVWPQKGSADLGQCA